MTPPSDGLPVPARYWAVLTIWLGLALSVLDAAIANVALPTIARDLAAAPAEAVWVVNAYQLTIVASLLPCAALGEIVGYRRVFIAGLIAFTAASLACTMVHTLPALAAARAIQGFGAAGLMGVNGALVRYTYPSAMLGRGIGYNALVASVSAAAGPSIASAILAVGPWQWLFAVNVPIGIAAFLIGRRWLPTSPTGGRLDVASTLLNVATFALIFTGIDVLTRGGIALFGVAELAIAAITGILLVRRSLRQARPLVPVDLLRSGVFALSVATSIASFAAQGLSLVAVPFLLESVLHRSQVETGLLMTPWPVAVGFAAPLAGRLSDRFPAGILGSIGLATLASGLLLLAFLPGDADTVSICWRMAVCGLGFGFFQAPNNRTLLSSAPLSRSGAAGGMLATARLTGQTTGATMAAICFHLPQAAETTALCVAAGFAGIALIASVSRLAYGPPAAQAQPQ